MPHHSSHLKKLKNTMKAVKNMRTLVKRRSEDQFDENLLQIIEEINHRSFPLSCVLRVFDGGKWLYVWLEKMYVNISLDVNRRLKMQVTIHYHCSTTHRVLSLGLRNSYDVVKVCRRLPNCYNDLEVLGLIYHHKCGRKEPFNASIDLYALKQFLKENVPNISRTVLQRGTYRVAYSPEQAEYAVYAVSEEKASTSFK